MTLQPIVRRILPVRARSKRDKEDQPPQSLKVLALLQREGQMKRVSLTSSPMSKEFLSNYVRKTEENSINPEMGIAKRPRRWLQPLRNETTADMIEENMQDLIIAESSPLCENSEPVQSFLAEAIERGEGIALTQADLDRGLTDDQIDWLVTHYIDLKALATALNDKL